MVKEIKLTQGKVSLVDDEDYERLSQYSWQACKGKNDNTFYAKRRINVFGKATVIPMQVEILGRKLFCVVDHIDGNGLNNQRSNLRYATKRQNSQNRHENKTSKYPGVSWHKRNNKWRSDIRINGKKITLGYFDDEHAAFMSYKNAVYCYTQQEVISLERWADNG